MSLVATTLDQLCQGRLTLEQPEKGYRFNTDTLLLAAGVTAAPGQSVLELGCGIGAVMLAASLRCEGCLFTGIERESVYAALAIKNIAANGADKNLSLIVGDVTDKELFKQLGTFDHVIANPPYFMRQEKTDVEDLRRAAREEESDLSDWVKAANRFLRPKGTVTFIHAAERLAELIEGMNAFCGDISVFPIFPNDGEAAKRVIIRGIKGSKAPLNLLPGLVLHEKGDNSYTERANRVLRHGQDLWQV